MAGRSLPHAMMMLIPEAWGTKYLMGDDKRAFYEYHAAFMSRGTAPPRSPLPTGVTLAAF